MPTKELDRLIREEEKQREIMKTEEKIAILQNRLNQLSATRRITQECKGKSGIWKRHCRTMPGGERRYNMMDIEKFKKEHKTFIAAGTTLIIVAVVMLVWKCVKQCRKRKFEDETNKEE